MVEAAQGTPALQRLLGTVLEGRYRIDALLGVGGMGAVFKAHHLLLKRDVALKVIHPELSNDPEYVKRFEREAESAARLDHPNIVQISEFGHTRDGMHYMVLRLAPGQPLTERMGWPLDPPLAIEIARQILDALEHAHGQGVVHRDLKPDNVLVIDGADGRAQVKLLDFGLAKLVAAPGQQPGATLTLAGVAMGTPRYISPELATGLPADERTDLYAVGTILYEMLAGRPPFDSDDMIAVMRMHVAVEPPSLPDSVPRGLQRVVFRLLEKLPGDRYQTAADAREGLLAEEGTAEEEATPTGADPPDPLAEPAVAPRRPARPRSRARRPLIRPSLLVGGALTVAFSTWLFWPGRDPRERFSAVTERVAALAWYFFPKSEREP